MTPETFCEQFATFAEAPNGVAKLRELILQLAVQGKLGTQDVNDEPASVLFDRVQDDRNADTKTKRRSASRTLPDVKPDEFPEVTPDGWKWIRLGQLADWAIGAGFPIASQGHTDMPYLFIKVSDMNLPSNGKLIVTAQNTIDDQIAKEIGARLHPAGTVVFPKIGGAIATNKRRILTRLTAIDNNCLGLTPIGLCDPDWLYLLLTSMDFAQYQSGTSVPALSQGTLELLVVGLPPLAEQRRIVGKVDQLLGLCDELAARQAARREARERLVGATLDRLVSARSAAEFPAHAHRLRDHFDRLFDTPTTLPQLRQAILQLAVQGQLVPQDPNDEPAINDLNEIEREKQAMIEARNLRPNRVSEIEQARVLQYQIPDSWRWFRLGDVAFFQEGPGIRNWQFRREGVKLLNVQNIVDEQLVLENSDRFVSIEEFEATYTHFRVEQGDILFASSGGSWGKTAWFEDPGYPVMLNTSMIRLKFYSMRCSDDYLLLFLRGQFFRKQMEIQLVGMQPNFGSTHLGRLYIPLPPLSEQKRIVSKVTELLSLCDALEAKLTQAESASTQLLAAAVAHLLQEGSPEVAKPRREKVG